MKKSQSKIPAVIGFIATLSLSVFAQTNLLTLDENGNGFINSTPLTYSVALDPNTGMSTLRYDLPFAGTPGVLILTNNAEPGNIISDLLIFDGTNHVFFYSDQDFSGGGSPSLADVGIPISFANPGSVTAVIPEVGIEGNNGGTYFAQFSFDPGWGGAGADSYTITSDVPVVPEPSTVALAALGAVGLLFFRRRK
jgi:hypothetical protein